MKFEGRKQAEIGIMLVSEKEQKKGHGKGMINFLEDYAKKEGAEEIMLTVLIKNPAVKFYKHLGYKEYKLVMKKDF